VWTPDRTAQRFAVIAALVTTATSGIPVANAACQCVCMNGEVEAVCSSSLDIQPICPPRICPIVPPAVRPIDPPRVPPIGASTCRSEQVWNGEEYEWVEVCR
jgi:hypothetical protein